MLEAFRRNLKHTKWILLFIVISFVFLFGVDWWRPGGGAAGSLWVARVNGEEISPASWRATAENTERTYRQIYKERYSEIADQIDPASEAADQLIQRKLIAQDARRLGLGVSAQELANAIRENPSFRGANGQFIGTENYRRLIERGLLRGFTKPSEFEEEVRESLLARKWTELLSASIVIDDRDVEEAFRRRQERAKLRYVALPVERYADEIEPTDAELSAWYAAHRDEFTVPEARRALYVSFDDALVADRIEITDEEIERYYDENRALFRQDEERRVAQILLRVSADAPASEVESRRELAQELADRARGGEDFAQLAARYSDSEEGRERGGEIGWIRRRQMVESFENAVFSLQPGEVAGPIRTPDGFHVVKLLDVRRDTVQPLDEVREQIRGQLKFRRLREAREEMARRFRERATDIEAFRQAAEEAGYEVHDTGPIAPSATLPELGPVPAVIGAIFDLEEGQVSDPIAVPRRTIVVALAEVLSPWSPPLEAVRDRVEEAFRRERAREGAREEMERALARARGDIDRLAKDLSLEVQTTDPPLLRGQRLALVGNSAAVERAAFEGPIGELNGPIEAGATLVALVVDERQEADMNLLAEQAESIRESLRSQRLRELVNARLRELQKEAVIEKNPQLFARRTARAPAPQS